MSSVSPAQDADQHRLRQALVALRQRVGLEFTALAAGLAEVRASRLYLGWGFYTFTDYCARELQLPMGTGPRLVALHALFRTEWDRAERIPWHCLEEAAPVVRAGLCDVPAALGVLEQPGAHRRAIRRWARDLLIPPANVDDSEATPDLDGEELRWGERGRRDAAVAPLPVVPGLRVVRRDEGTPTRPERVLCGLLLSRPVYERLAAALAGDAPVDDRVLALLRSG